MFWGVANSRTIAGYRNNVEGEWDAIPRMLALFRQYDVCATWATVGMLMCRDHNQWREIRPSILPGYLRQQYSAYSLDKVAREYPKLFFARPLVEQILETPGQELATHTYSHFYCGEQGATPEQFSADIACAQVVASDMGARCGSLVFPRNQVRKEFVAELTKAGIQAYRGNPDHWLYRDGHITPGGIAGRAVRFADAWLPLTGAHVAYAVAANGLANVPASLFLRPWPSRLAALEPMRMARLKHAMTTAARQGRICHLWWHPHNFGVDVEQNLAVLESLLRHYCILQGQYGMRSLTMAAVARRDVEKIEQVTY
jgi:peptidoglycan/xylan/chitin deacetylase (PgdA/CDA1 family)